MKLLIVDDEMQIRIGIEKGIAWKKYGINDVIAVNSGIKALEVIEKEDIDILLTDIRMPGMDGLQLAREAKRIKEEMKIIIFSGFSEFKYAKKAINIGVKDYLLKPIKIPELVEIVAGVVEELKVEKEKKEEKQKKDWERVLAQQFLAEEINENDLLKVLQELGLEVSERVFCILLEADSCNVREIQQCREDMQYIIKKIAAEQPGIVLEIQKQILWIIKLDILHSRWEIIQKLESVLNDQNRKRKSMRQVTLSAAVSEIHTGYDLPKTYKECTCLLNNRLYKGTGQIFLQEIEKGGKKLSFYFEEEERLRQYILQFQYKRAQEYIQEHFKKMRELKISSYDLAKGACLMLKQILFCSIKETGLDVESVLEKNKDFVLEVPDFLTLQQYETWICDLYFLILKGVSEHTERNISNSVIKAITYIRVHYQEEISVDAISAYVNKSPNYFSYLFKKEMKISFTEYLNRYRIEQACKLLESSLNLTGEIGQQVGFRDEKYFSAVFKKIMGCPPSAYRRNKGVGI